MLRKMADAYPTGHRNIALVRLHFGQNHPQQGRFSMAVRSDDADLFASLDQTAGIMEEFLITERFVNSLDL